MSGRDLTAPEEGTASTAGEIADELCDATVALEHVNYNALAVGELRELLAARETLMELCKRYRRQQDRRPAGREGGR